MPVYVFGGFLDQVGRYRLLKYCGVNKKEGTVGYLLAYTCCSRLASGNRNDSAGLGMRDIKVKFYCQSRFAGLSLKY